MATKTTKIDSASGSRKFFNDLARAYGGSILFSFPILMTMEMWWQGFTMSGYRLALFSVLALPLLVGLSYFDGFEDTFTGGDDVRETFVAYFVGFSSATLLLFLFGVITASTSAHELLGKISVQAVPASLGAMFAQSILGGSGAMQKDAEDRKRSATYWGQLFLTIVGALFLSMSVAPTEEMYLISYQMTDMHTVGLALVSIIVMHGFIYAVELRGFELGVASRTPFLSLFFRYTVTGYAVVLLISFYILWTFGSIDDMEVAEKIKVTIVLGFPAAIGGSASRLIL